MPCHDTHFVSRTPMAVILLGGVSLGGVLATQTPGILEAISINPQNLRADIAQPSTSWINRRISWPRFSTSKRMETTRWPGPWYVHSPPRPVWRICIFGVDQIFGFGSAQGVNRRMLQQPDQFPCRTLADGMSPRLHLAKGFVIIHKGI